MAGFSWVVKAIPPRLLGFHFNRCRDGLNLGLEVLPFVILEEFQATRVLAPSVIRVYGAGVWGRLGIN